MITNYTLRLALLTDVEVIWHIILQAIAKRKAEGSMQWQDSYPNIEIITADILKQEGYVVTTLHNEVVAYMVLSVTGEPVYHELTTGWLTYQSPYMVIHRLAITQQPKIKGLAYWMLQQAEAVAQQKGVKSIKVDTNYDNAPMLHLFKKLNYTYAGEVYFRGSARMAFEKLI